jgi:hypothetical protein
MKAHARWLARGGTVVAITVAWLPRLAVPLTATGCVCGERGSAVEFDAATVERQPEIVVEGDACNAKSVECMHRDAKDRCDVFWIDPIKEGRCIFSARFSDGTRIEEAIDYELDGKYPCRGNVRPRHDHVTRIYSGSGT